jgi:hypothetical protein
MDSNPAKFRLKRPSLPIRLAIYAAVIVGVTFLLYHFWLSRTARMEIAISKLKSPDPAVRLQGAKDALGLNLSRKDQERLALTLRNVLELETAKDTKVKVLGLMSYTAVSEKNVNTIVKYFLSDDTDVADAAISLARLYACLYPRQAWKIVATLSFLKGEESYIGKEAAGILEDLLGEGPTPVSISVVDARLKLKFSSFDTKPHFEICDNPCNAKTGEKLDAETIENRTAEAREFAKRFNLPE